MRRNAEQNWVLTAGQQFLVSVWLSLKKAAYKLKTAYKLKKNKLVYPYLFFLAYKLLSAYKLF